MPLLQQQRCMSYAPSEGMSKDCLHTHHQTKCHALKEGVHRHSHQQHHTLLQIPSRHSMVVVRHMRSMAAMRVAMAVIMVPVVLTAAKALTACKPC